MADYFQEMTNLRFKKPNNPNKDKEKGVYTKIHSSRTICTLSYNANIK